MGLVSIDRDYFLGGLRQYASSPEIEALVREILQGPFTLWKVRRSLDLLALAIEQVERLAADAGEIGAGTGASKRKAVLDFLDDTVLLPWWAERFDNALIGALIDQAVKELNELHPQGWIDRAKGFVK